MNVCENCGKAIEYGRHCAGYECQRKPMTPAEVRRGVETIVGPLGDITDEMIQALNERTWKGGRS